MYAWLSHNIFTLPAIYFYFVSFKIDLKFSLILKSLLISYLVLDMKCSIYHLILLSLKTLLALRKSYQRAWTEFPLWCSYLLQTLSEVDDCCSIVVFILPRTKNFTVFPQLRWLNHRFLVLFLYSEKAMITTGTVGVGINYFCVIKSLKTKPTSFQMPLLDTWDVAEIKHMKLFIFVDTSSREPHSFSVYSLSPGILVCYQVIGIIMLRPNG